MENSVNKKIYFKLYNFIFILPLLIGFTTSAFSKHLKPEEFLTKVFNNEKGDKLISNLKKAKNQKEIVLSKFQRKRMFRTNQKILPHHPKK